MRRVGDGRNWVIDGEGEVTAGDAEDFLGVERLFGGGDGLGVADQIVEATHTRSRVHIEPIEDHRRRTKIVKRQSAHIAIAVQIDQDVDLRFANKGGETFVGEACGVEETVGESGTVALLYGGLGRVGEKVDVEGGAVMLIDEAPDGFHPVVALEERRDVADTEAVAVFAPGRAGLEWWEIVFSPFAAGVEDVLIV